MNISVRTEQYLKDIAEETLEYTIIAKLTNMPQRRPEEIGKHWCPVNPEWAATVETLMREA
jgi:hypothetical protein